MNDNNLSILIEIAKGIRMTSEQEEEQRRSFAFGNSNIESKRITRESVNREAQQLATENGQKHPSR